MLLGAAAFCSVETAAALVGVAPSSVYDLRKRDHDFEKLWQTARARTCVLIELATLRNATKLNNFQAQAFLLTNLMPDKYRIRREVEVSTGIDVRGALRAAAEAAREEKRRRLKAAIVTAEVISDGNGNGGGDARALIVSGNGRGGNGNGSG